MLELSVDHSHLSSLHFQHVLLRWKVIEIKCPDENLQVVHAADEKLRNFKYCQYVKTLAPVKSADSELVIRLEGSAGKESIYGFYATFEMLAHTGNSQGKDFPTLE